MTALQTRDVLAAHFVMWHDAEDGRPSEWRCSCGMRFGFSDTAIDHVAHQVEKVAMLDTLTELREKGNRRRDRWHTPDTEPWTGADWSNAMCGEAGEAANVVKKIRRIETGTGSDRDPLREDLIRHLAWELADTIAYADILAQHYGIDLRAAIAEKFNIVSEREGFPERMTIPGSEATR